MSSRSSKSRYRTEERLSGSRALPTRRHLYEQIWEAVELIPTGQVATYGQVAAYCGIPGQARLVGYALHNLPRGSGVTWHRVINARGMISLSDIDGMYEEQKRLLRREGVRFVRDVIDLGRYRWKDGVVHGWRSHL